jgi:hypothetical protein
MERNGTTLHFLLLCKSLFSSSTRYWPNALHSCNLQIHLHFSFKAVIRNAGSHCWVTWFHETFKCVFPQCFYHLLTFSQLTYALQMHLSAVIPLFAWQLFVLRLRHNVFPSSSTLFCFFNPFNVFQILCPFFPFTLSSSHQFSPISSFSPGFLILTLVSS